jgi:acyl carrier protein
MSDAAFLDQVTKVFRETFDKPDLVLYDAMQAKDVEGWDSLNHITLIVGIEEEFKIKFTTREVMGFQNVGEMLACLRGKLLPKG